MRRLKKPCDRGRWYREKERKREREGGGTESKGRGRASPVAVSRQVSTSSARGSPVGAMAVPVRMLPPTSRNSVWNLQITSQIEV